MLGCAPVPEFAGISGFHQRTRAFVKVQDGCNMHCAYCIIPSIRPTLSCKPYEELEREVGGLVDRGVREIVVCGVRLGRYLVRDIAGRRVDFVAMLDRLLALPGDFRIRLSSLEVTDLTDRLIDLLVRSEGKLCPSFHVPLQAGADAVLSRMGRWYSAAFYARRIAALRARWPDAGLFSDVMVGFPGETDAHFEDGHRFIASLGFSGLHVFRYSKRPGTLAARFREQVPEPCLLDRARRMRELDHRLRVAFAAEALGSRRRVIIEEGGAAPEGLTDHFLRVRFAEPPGRGLLWARIVSTEGPSALAQRA
jgi:threonylcarbamoyladenosine tRNA methylthiotransferase MtaB